jgi:hypothetical protein
MDRQHLGMPFRAGEGGVYVQFSEIPADSLVGFLIQRLVAKEQDLVFRQGLMQIFDLPVAERLGERDALDHGADAGRNWRDHDGRIAHGFTFRGWTQDTEKTIDLDVIVRSRGRHIKARDRLAWRRYPHSTSTSVLPSLAGTIVGWCRQPERRPRRSSRERPARDSTR